MNDTTITVRDCFLSYSHADKPRAHEIIAFLEREGITVYSDQESAAGNIQEQEDKWVRNSHCMVLLLGPNGIGNEQKNEITKAKSRQSQKELVKARYMMIPVMLPWDPKTGRKTPPLVEYADEYEILPLELTKHAGVELNTGITLEGLDKLCNFIRAEAKFANEYADSAIAPQKDRHSDVMGNSGFLGSEIGDNETTDRVANAASTGDSEGLRDWEHSYLTRSIARWRLGFFAAPRKNAKPQKSVKSRKSLHGMYSPEVCVPLLGVASSGRYIADLQRQIRPVTIDPKEGAPGQDSATAKTYLAYWLTAKHPRHLVIEGQAGAGKTQFITRAAAVLGERYLGSSNDCDLVLNEAIDAADACVLPIIFEASRVSEMIETSDDDDLITALAELVQASVSSKGAVDASDIEKRLSEGKVLLVADGLDEVGSTEDRTNLLLALATISQRYGRIKIVLTARSRAYTHQFVSTEKEIVRIEPLGKEERDKLCLNFAKESGWSVDVANALVESVNALSKDLRVSSDEQDILDNPMMLTLACAYYLEIGDLPKNRAALVDGIVDRLCERNSVVRNRDGVKLTPIDRRRYLRQIAFGMQKDGGRLWPKRRALTAIRRDLKSKGLAPKEAKECSDTYLKDIINKTNIIRNIQISDEPEVRFWHGLFQEYLCAEELIDRYSTHQALFEWLKKNEYFSNRFWGNVIRFLPAALAGNDAERRAWQYCNGLIQLAQRNLDPIEQSRLVELAVDGVNQGSAVILQDDRDAIEFWNTVSAVYRLNGYRWPLRQRTHILNGLARLGAKWGKVVPFERGWVKVPAHELDDQRADSFEIFNSPVTVQDFWEFLNAKDQISDPEIWDHAPDTDRFDNLMEFKSTEMWLSQQRFPGRPATGVTWFEAVVYCRWRQKFFQSTTDYIIRLPTQLEWTAAARGRNGNKYPWGDDDPFDGDDAQANWRGAGLGEAAPIGVFPPVFNGRIYDLGSNVYEFAYAPFSAGNPVDGAPLKLGASWKWRKDKLRVDAPRRTEDPWVRDPENGFRCARVKKNAK